MTKHLSDDRIRACVSGVDDYTGKELRHLQTCSTCQAVQTVVIKALAAAFQEKKKPRSRARHPKKRKLQR
jgi:hypothetical protein